MCRIAVVEETLMMMGLIEGMATSDRGLMMISFGHGKGTPGLLGSNEGVH